MQTLLLGLGNPILTDDGVGIRAAEAVRAALPPGAPVTVGEACVGGLGLMERLVGYRRAILIDAICTGDAPPGAVRRLTLDDLRTITPPRHTASTHDAPLLTALETGRQMGLPLPDDIVLFAIEAANVSDFGETLTPPVAAAIPEVVQRVLTELATRNPQPATLNFEL
ncbi:MAG: hydrogenase maturation protease [Caldilineae bacterium]|nr:MAG: hydrogenase maturation protease [Caldilineae bacterium]